MKKSILSAVSACLVLFLSACGGGGSGTANGTSNQNSTTETVISGMASKGPITGKIYFYVPKSDGSKDLLTSTDIVQGIYSANIGKYAGPVLIQVTGSYTDEATSRTNIPLEVPLQAALANASGIVTAAVTPLTDLAVKKAGALTAANIAASNNLISDIFKIDIINTQPVAPTLSALSAGAVTQSQKDYTLALAAISQLSATNTATLTATLTNIASNISFIDGMGNRSIAANFKQAISDIKTNNANFIDVSSASFVNVGTRTASYTFAISRNPATNVTNIYGISFDIVVPAGLTVRYDPFSIPVVPQPGSSAVVTYDNTKGVVLPGIVTVLTATTALQPYAIFSSVSGDLTFNISTTTGIGAGNLATVTFDVLPGYSIPRASDFSIGNYAVYDGGAAPVNGVSVTVQ